MNDNRKSLLSAIGPGILVAATGVGAGDIMTASLGGSAVGVCILWAAVVGALLKWFLNERTDPSYYSTWRIRVEQYIDFLLETEDVFKIPTGDSPIPESWAENPRNLGYDDYTMIGQSYQFDAYLVINEMGRKLHSMFPTVPQFNVSDIAFDRLGNDSTANLLYSNGGLDVWHISSVK